MPFALASARRRGWAWLGLWLCCVSSRAWAYDWKGIVPGESTSAQVIEKLGRPSKQMVVKGIPMLVYTGRQATPGSKQVQVRLDAPDGKVVRIDFFPVAPLTEETIENTYGPKCQGDAAAGCHVRKASNDGIQYWSYPVEGLVVFFNPGGTARSLSFIRAKPLVVEPVGPTPPGPGTEPSGPDPRTLDAVENTSLTDQETKEALERDPLQIGGEFYFRGNVGLADQPTGGCCQVQPGTPFQIDAYFDGRPTSRIRAMARPRFLYNPIPENSGSLGLQLNTPATGAVGFSNVAVALDQLWLSFDIAGSVFVTVGRQHMKWGVTRFWSSTDFLAGQRNPLAVFDARLGIDMVKLQVPIESIDANLYAFGYLDPQGLLTAQVLPGAGVRGEIAFWTAEVGAGALLQVGRRPRFAADVSMGLGPIDIAAEVGIRNDRDRVQWREVVAPDLAAGSPGFWAPTQVTGPQVSTSGSVTWPVKLSDLKTLTFGTEVFYQSAGYDDARALAWLFATDEYQPFYFGKLYGALFAQYAESDPQWSITGTLLSNLLDQSFVGRFDFSWKFFNALTVEAFTEVPFGAVNGEFRPAFRLTPQTTPDGRELPGLVVPLSFIRFGIGLRISV